MNEIQRNNVHIDVCPKCRGVWLDGGEMEKLLGQVRQFEQEYEAELESYRRQAPQQFAPPRSTGQAPPPPHPQQRHDQRNPYDTDDDDYHKRHGKRKSKLGRLFDIFD
jgi:Zn-finger nucleic acid-binding protein